MSVYRTPYFETDESGKRWACVKYRATGNSISGDCVSDVSGLPVVHPVTIYDCRGLVQIQGDDPKVYDATYESQEVDFTDKENKAWSFRCLSSEGGVCICKHDPENPADFAYVSGWFEEGEIDIEHLYVRGPRT